MHIPKGGTAAVELVRFDEALEAALEPSPDYDITQWLYVPNYYGEYRYILGTRGEKPLICVGVNPSTAAPGDLDNTLKSVAYRAPVGSKSGGCGRIAAIHQTLGM